MADNLRAARGKQMSFLIPCTGRRKHRCDLNTSGASHICGHAKTRKTISSLLASTCKTAVATTVAAIFCAITLTRSPFHLHYRLPHTAHYFVTFTPSPARTQHLAHYGWPCPAAWRIVSGRRKIDICISPRITFFFFFFFFFSSLSSHIIFLVSIRKGRNSLDLSALTLPLTWLLFQSGSPLRSGAHCRALVLG